MDVLPPTAKLPALFDLTLAEQLRTLNDYKQEIERLIGCEKDKFNPKRRIAAYKIPKGLLRHHPDLSTMRDLQEGLEQIEPRLQSLRAAFRRIAVGSFEQAFMTIASKRLDPETFAMLARETLTTMTQLREKLNGPDQWRVPGWLRRDLPDVDANNRKE